MATNGWLPPDRPGGALYGLLRKVGYRMPDVAGSCRQNVMSPVKFLSRADGPSGASARSAVQCDRRWARVILSVESVLLGALMAGCWRCEKPDQSQFAPLAQLTDSGQAIVRVYGAPIPFLEPFVIHTWVLTKRAEERAFHRWEVWRTPGGDYVHVRKDRLAPTADIGAGKTFIIGQVKGHGADSIVAFVESESPQYPLKETYIAFPGPNSNTFTQWVLDNSGWELVLPPCAVGAQWGRQQEP